MHGRFVSQKISRTRWRPEPGSSLRPPQCLATGSWDAEQNKVCLWETHDIDSTESDQLFVEDPELLCEIKHNGDVMDLQFLDQERIVTASSTGSVTVFRHHPNSQTLSVARHWNHVHYHSNNSAPCTSLVCSGPDIITVGEDGRINHFQVDLKEPVRTIDNADSSSLNAITFLRTTEILTVNSIGQLKIWDFRQPGNKPLQIYSFTDERVPLHCVDRHPNQQHIVATGGQDGTLCIWDVRQGNVPISVLDAHSAEMWEVHFHPSNPDHVFTCSEDGSLWHWNASIDNSEKPSFLQGKRNFALNNLVSQVDMNQSVSSAWVTSDVTKGKLDAKNLLSDYILSVNSLDVVGEHLVCGTDAEAIYVTRDLQV
ncbi:nucleoporin Nup43 [Pristis pectinata]|uniref:nucleoporin Nup43 n=1 Tax=Pristis pectinata TaxID=685728 RepID=UPI00223C9A2B|nr:nucleoporin Nup43 [Pristis pectinata]